MKYFIRKKCGFLVAGWIEKRGNELHGDYEYVKNKEEGIKKLKEYGYKEGESDLSRVLSKT